MTNKPKLKVIGKDGNAFFILGNAHRAAMEAGWTKEQWTEVQDKAMAGDYDNLLRVMVEHFDVR